MDSYRQAPSIPPLESVRAGRTGVADVLISDPSAHDVPPASARPTKSIQGGGGRGLPHRAQNAETRAFPAPHAGQYRSARAAGWVPGGPY